MENEIRSSREDNDSPGTYYVSQSGDDSNDGLSIETALRHISFAVDRSDAGDTIYVLEGIYEDEHVSFPSGGIAVAPIRLLAYSGRPVLDGLDMTGSAVTVDGKSYIEISGFRIMNYGEGIKGRGTVTHLYLHDFELDNINSSGLDFGGVSVQKCRITNFTINNTSVDEGTSISHFDYTGTDTFDVEIADFTITTASGEAINWRNTKRVHIHNGTIRDCGSDAIHLQLNVHGSVVSNVHIENTGWHGIAIHDHTVGEHPCYNNRIINCYVYGASHNDVDLHSGTFNTVVEDCELDGPPETGQGIYFHNLGAGLIARNNTIHDTGDGIDGGPSDDQFLQDIIVENNTIYNCSGIMWQGSTENIVIRGNIIYDCSTSECIHVGAYNILMERNNIDGKVYRINSGNGKILDALDGSYSVKSGYGAEIEAGHTDGKVFQVEPVSPPHITAPGWYPHGGFFNVFSDSEYPWSTPLVTTYPMTAVPAADPVGITVNEFDTSLPRGDILVDFTAETLDGNNVVFTVGDLTPDRYYLVKKNGVDFFTGQADADGYIQFSNSQWPSCNFTIEETGS